MNEFLRILLIGTATISIIPAINLNKSYRDDKYVCLKYLINTAFIWTILVFINLLAESKFLFYYSHIFTYPIKFLLSSFMVCTLFNYIEKKIPKYLMVAFLVFLSIEFIFAILNPWIGSFIDASISDISLTSGFANTDYGFFFIYHLIVNYSILVIGIGYFLYYLAKHKDIRQYKVITYTMVISILIVLSANLLQLLVLDTEIDLTYVSLVIVSYTLYRIIYKRDMIFNLKTSGRGEILSNMREMYILTDRDKNIVEISQLLMTNYDVNEDHYIGKHLDDLIKYLMNKIIFYSEYDFDQEEDEHKDHFHLREKRFKLKGMNDYGYMILLYDQTQVFNLLRELNKLSNFDSMTGLNNRNYIERKLDELNPSKNIGIISLDLNGLKVNNDYLGHERGDFLLKTLAQKIKEASKPYKHKHMARIGGDEFVVILEDSSEDQVDKLKAEILKLCEHKEIDKRISVSIGTAFSQEQEDIFHLLRTADHKMYEMKRVSSEAYKIKIVEYAKKTNKFIR